MSSADDEAFPKLFRLRARREFLVVQRHGKRATTDHFIFYGRPNGRRLTRIGVTASKKVGKAVVRNRVKRCVREAFRRQRAAFPIGYDVVVVARSGHDAIELAQVAGELEVGVTRVAVADRGSPRSGRRRRKR